MLPVLNVLAAGSLESERLQSGNTLTALRPGSLESGGLQYWSLQSRANVFGSGNALNGLELGA